MNLGKELAEILKDIGQALNIAPTYKRKYKYKPKSDKEAIKEDWDNVGNIFKDIMGNDKK